MTSPDTRAAPPAQPGLFDLHVDNCLAAWAPLGTLTWFGGKGEERAGREGNLSGGFGESCFLRVSWEVFLGIGGCIMGFLGF